MQRMMFGNLTFEHTFIWSPTYLMLLINYSFLYYLKYFVILLILKSGELR